MTEFAQGLVLHRDQFTVGLQWPVVVKDTLGEDLDKSGKAILVDVSKQDDVKRAKDALYLRPCLTLRILRIGKATKDEGARDNDVAWMGWNILGWHIHDHAVDDDVGPRAVAPIVGACADEPHQACGQHTENDPAIVHLEPELKKYYPLRDWIAAHGFKRSNGAEHRQSRPRRSMADPNSERLTQEQVNILRAHTPLYVETETLIANINASMKRSDRVFFPQYVGDDDGDPLQHLQRILRDEKESAGRYALLREDNERVFERPETINETVDGRDIRIRRGSVLINPDGVYLSFWIFDKPKQIKKRGRDRTKSIFGLGRFFSRSEDNS